MMARYQPIFFHKTLYEQVNQNNRVLNLSAKRARHHGRSSEISAMDAYNESGPWMVPIRYA